MIDQITMLRLELQVYTRMSILDTDKLVNTLLLAGQATVFSNRDFAIEAGEFIIALVSEGFTPTATLLDVTPEQWREALAIHHHMQYTRITKLEIMDVVMQA